MSQSESTRPSRTFDYYTIIPDSSNRQILMLSDERGWSLPHFETTEPHYWQEVAHVNRLTQDMLGLDVTTLRCILTDYNPDTARAHRVYAMENHSPAWKPQAGGRWIDRDMFRRLPLAVMEHRTILDAWFADADGDSISPLRKPWTMPGWYATAIGWIHEQLRDPGLATTGPFEQLRAWERSYLLRVNTTGGYAYFKALPKMFGFEPQLTQALFGWYPEHFPNLLAVDTERHWMLMPDFGGRGLVEVVDVEPWEEALSTLAQIQMGLAPRTDDLLALGCPDRRLSKLATQIEPFLAGDPSALQLGREPLTDAEIAELRSMIPRLKAMCHQLASYAVPESLEHGDLWPDNIVATDRSYLIFDWSDSSVAHPFFSMLLIFSDVEVKTKLPKVPDVRARLRDAYLKPWAVYEPAERLVEAFDLALALAPLQYALIYHHTILPNMEFKWEMENMLPFYLRMLLA